MTNNDNSNNDPNIPDYQLPPQNTPPTPYPPPYNNPNQNVNPYQQPQGDVPGQYQQGGPQYNQYQQYPTQQPPNQQQSPYQQQPPYQGGIPQQGQPAPSYYSQPNPMYGSGVPYGSFSPGGPSTGASLWGRRIGAFLIDALILVIPQLIVDGILRAMFFPSATATVVQTNHSYYYKTSSSFYAASFVIGVIVLLLSCLYYGLMDSATRGSVGKRALKIRVVQEGTNQAPTLLFAALRMAIFYLLFIFLQFPFGLLKLIALVGIVNSFMPLWAKDGMAIHDKLTKTKIVSAFS